MNFQYIEIQRKKQPKRNFVPPSPGFCFPPTFFSYARNWTTKNRIIYLPQSPTFFVSWIMSGASGVVRRVNVRHLCTCAGQDVQVYYLCQAFTLCIQLCCGWNAALKSSLNSQEFSDDGRTPTSVLTWNIWLRISPGLRQRPAEFSDCRSSYYYN